MFRPRKPSSAFTLLELIVVIVILAVLAAIAVPTFSAVIDRSHDETTEVAVASYARSVQAHAGFRGDGTVLPEDFEAAAADFQRMAGVPGVTADGYSVLVRPHPTRADRFDDQALSVVSYALSSDETVAGVAAVSASGNCVAVRMTATSVQTVSMPDAAEYCTGRTALDTASPQSGEALDPSNPGALSTPDVQAGARTTSSATVSWSAVPGATSYTVEVAENDLMTAAVSSTTSERSYTVSTTWDAPRYVRVAAVAGSSTSQPSKVVKVVGALVAPQNVALEINDATATISWTPVAGATGYRIYQDGSSVFVRQVPGGTTDRTSFELAPGQSTSFIVKAYNADGESAASNSVSGTVSASTPSGVTARVDGTEAVVSWNKVASATGYEVYRNGVIGATVVGADTTSHRFPIMEGETLTFAVRSYDPNDGKSAASAEVTATRAPAAPTASHTANDNTVTFNWTAPTGATGYTLYLNSDPVETTTATSKSYTLPYSSTNTFKVTANNTGGDGPVSNTVTMTVVPAAPTGVSATATETTATVRWTPVTGANGYHIYNAATDAQVATISGQTSSQQTVPMTAGEAASYYVKAYGNGGLSKASASATTAAVPTAPATVSSTLSGTTVTITWTRSTTADAYELYKGTVFVKDVDGGSTTSTTTTIAQGETATFSVLAKNTAGKSAATAGNSVTAAPAAPAAPAVSYNANTHLATLTWSAVNGVTGYEIWQRYTHLSTGAVNSVKIYDTTATTYKDIYVHDGYAVEFGILAWNAAGTSGAINYAPPVQSTQVENTAPAFSGTNILSNGSFESGTPGWATYAQAGYSTSLVYYSAGSPNVNPYHGTRLAALNVSGENRGSIYTDVGVSAPAGARYCISAMVESQGTEIDASGILWLRSLNNGGVDTVRAHFSHLPGNPNWLRASGCFTLQAASTGLRAEVVGPGTPYTLFIDDVRVWRVS